MEVPFRGSGDWLRHRSPSAAEGPQRSRHDEQEVGTFLATRGDLHGHQRGPQLATSGDFLMATDNECAPELPGMVTAELEAYAVEAYVLAFDDHNLARDIPVWRGLAI